VSSHAKTGKTDNHTYANTLENPIGASFFAQSSKTQYITGRQSAPTRSQQPNSKPIDGPRPPQTPAASLYAGHVQQLGGANPLPNLMEVKG